MLTIVLSLAVTACDKKESTPIHAPEPQETYEDFLLSVEALNLKYSILPDTSTRSFPGWATGAAAENFADGLGAKAGAWIGRKVGASFGIALANPVVGIAGYLIGGKAGGLAGAAAFSYAASCFFNKYVTKSGWIPTYETCLAVATQKDTVSYSFGDLHNMILDSLFAGGKSYVSSPAVSGGVPKFEADSLIEDILDFEVSMGIDDELSRNPVYLTSIKKYCKQVFKKAFITVLKSESAEYYIDDMSEYMINQGMPSTLIDNYKALQMKLLTAVSNLDDSQIENYSKDYIRTVQLSELSDEEKSEAEAVGSVVVSSALYWKNH